MKFFVKLILSILLILTSVLILFASTIKFQFLQPNYWKDMFNKYNVYLNLSNDLKEDVVLKEIVTPEIVKDLVIRNIDLTLGFANGQKKEFLVYIPKTKIHDSEELPLTALLTKYNIKVAEDLPISQIAFLGLVANYILIGLSSLFVILILLIYVLTDNNKRLVSIGIPIVFTGFLILVISKLFSFFNINKIIIRSLLPPLLVETSKAWSVIGIILLVTGILFFILKKPK